MNPFIKDYFTAEAQRRRVRKESLDWVKQNMLEANALQRLRVSAVKNVLGLSSCSAFFL
jgi:hypothetical protein